ncbi:MAG TPA: hypothetical protein VHA37_09715 [Candidatus Saccharimonadales bacterium]|nr:hypothetical protein [Candidatus Saccharimonadales bacterium]
MSPMASDGASLYDKVVGVTLVYLGPAAERFIARQVENHLHRAPGELSQADLAGLIDWIHAAVSLLTEDSDIVEEYVAELQKLAGLKDDEGSDKSGKSRKERR